MAAEEAVAAPSARGRVPLRGLTVLYDPDCRLCAFVGDWLAGQRKLIPVRLVPVGSERARRLFPALDHDGATRREITVVGDTGQVYVGDTAWVVCLWALADHRALAHTMSTPAGRRLARAAVLGVARYRGADRTPRQPGGHSGRRPAPPGADRIPVRTARMPGDPSRTAWVYEGNGGWTARRPGDCADGCEPPG
ncbi:thiol-disulfide oxidoreductase DCC family protein [Actinacidiphila paucisporea]|uniref:DUF393 domain-containing protein n=1 Tax=Actinacidiphila paucisporea TaxID=310782 RepID=A0A1M6U696_9ACTN|nr:DCC1-like thiol-disulfide oxidoreductase family protein [Actinacidiphila paucisporea]SHK64805.1 Protein of unknown function, DUF393 [Actinacidiphila paucisporea]